MPKEEKKEIVVRAPSRPVGEPEKKAEKIVEKALEEERYGVLQVSRRISRYFGSAAIVAGLSLMVLVFFAAFTDQSNIAIPANPSLTIVSLWLAVGLVSIAAGFLLMGSE